MDKIKTLLKRRKDNYGDTHILAGYVMGLLKDPLSDLLANHPKFAHNWVLILSKLIRILFNPYHLDNYDDIIGYATLCRQMAEEKGDKK